MNISEKPWIINLELTNACNLSCIFCDYPVLKRKMSIKEMDERLLEKVFLNIKADKIYELGLVGLGEPTLARSLGRHLQIINAHADIFERITFNSNLVTLNKKTAEVLLNSRINTYTFSVNASNRQAYQKMMGKDKFDVVIENLKSFLSLVKGQRVKPRIDVQLFDFEQNNMDELKKLLPETTDLNVNFFCRKLYNKPVLKESSEHLNIHMPGDDARYPCWDIYTRIYIDVEGNLYPCTIGNDSYREASNLCLGNILEDTTLNLFNNLKIQEARHKAEKGFLPFPECGICNIWSLTPNNFEWDASDQIWRKKEKQVRAYGLRG